MTITDYVGYLSATLVALSFCSNNIIKLRLFAILSNISFITYAALANLTPILILHGFLLPVNVTMLVLALYPSLGVRASSVKLRN